MGVLDRVAATILAGNQTIDGDGLLLLLDGLYDAEGLAAMVLHRYPVVPVISDYQEIICESIEAHFLGLGHVAVAGLLPVVEGAGRQLLRQRTPTGGHTKDALVRLAMDCKREAQSKNLGDPGEIASMMDSFVAFARGYLYVNSKRYPLDDKTNRHGILHGDFSDADYGSPINFYKVIGTVDFLTFVSSFRAQVSWFAPDATPNSTRLAAYFTALRGVRKMAGASET